MFTHHAVKICTAADRADANAALDALGWGPDTHSVPLRTKGTTGPATHYAGILPLGEERIAEVDLVKGGQRLQGITLAQQKAVSRITSDRLTSEQMSGTETTPPMTDRQHFDAVLASMNLEEIAV